MINIPLEKTSVLFVYTFRVGGITTAIEMYKKVLKKNKYQIHEVGFFADIDVKSDKEKTVIQTLEQRGLFISLKNMLKMAKTIHSLNKKYNFDIIQVNTIWQLVAIRLLPGLYTKKIIYFFHGLETKENESWGNTIDKPYFHFFTKMFEQLLPILASKIVIFSDYSELILIKHIFLLRYFRKKLLKGDFFVKNVRKLAKTPSKNQLTILNFGRAEPRKGLDLLLEAIHLLKNKIKINLIIISPASFFHSGFLKTYEDLNLFDQVTVLHKASLKQKELIIKKSDIFVMPSKDLETFGISVIESLSAGLPVISSNNGALNEIMSKFDAKFIFKPYTAQKLAEKIHWYFKLSKNEKIHYQNLALSTISSNYSLNSKKEQKILNLFNK